VRPEIGISLLKSVRRKAFHRGRDRRVAFIATGGRSHFCLDEEFNRNLIAAMQHNDQKVITSVPQANLKSSSAESTIGSLSPARWNP
jgi:hypothetical protein